GVEAPLAQALDAQGGHWFGYHDNTLAVRHSDNTTTVYTRADGLRVANVSAISLGRYTLAGGPKGLALLAGSRFVMIRATDPAALQSAFSVAEAPNGDVWINTLRGAERIASAEMQALVKDAGRRVRVQYFDAQDGYPGPGASSVRYWNRTVVALDNGVVWFAGREGIARISAAGLDDHGKPPSVVVRSLTAAQRRFDLSSPVHLPKGTDQVQIDYTALASLRPDRLRFRYRLQGVDKAWVEADGRRQAFYVNLGPGSYRFEVTAAEGFEDWVAAPAAFEFHIEYRFVETRTFLALCAAGAAVLLFAGYRLRVRRLTERERSRTQLRMLERERIARDLHDTLLQSVTGLALQIHATARQLPEDSPQRASLQHVLSRANSTIVEGRDRVRELRGGTTVGSSLTEALRTAAADITHENPAVRLTVLEEGRPEPLKDSVRDEAFCIAREAMTNAVRHGNPDAVDISVRYASAELVVCVRDDGSGIPPQVLDAGARAGHWGLAGMAERAGRLGARLELSNRPEGGTQVLLRVPAARAFGRCRLRPWRRMRRGF
ncbi:MAG TPA: histidine kinase, partial [Rubrivivax sp.]|nr:histidine kinase [Rubrivivax sp.]